MGPLIGRHGQLNPADADSVTYKPVILRTPALVLISENKYPKKKKKIQWRYSPAGPWPTANMRVINSVIRSPRLIVIVGATISTKTEVRLPISLLL